MKHLFLLCIFQIYVTSIISQVRGVDPVTESMVIPSKLLKGDPGKRQAAIVVGISKYNSTRLHLNYAHSDAELFADYLHTTRTFPAENIFLMQDSSASSGKIYNRIHELMKILEAGDELLLYFAGHGDVQNVADFDEAFFLAWDASDTRNYYGAGGTLDLTKLQLYVNNLATKKKVKVSLVMDACHSGFDLYKNGLLKAQENVIEGFDNIYKMLGCASNELSFEADSIKHGLFTWYLVQGLMGLADNPSDNKLESAELQQWVKSSVSAATGGKQNPVISAPAKDEYVIAVSPQSRAEALTRFRNRKFTTNFAGRGVGDSNQNPTNNDLQYYVRKYNAFLEKGKYYGSDSSCLGVIKEVNERADVTYRQDLLTSLKNHLAEVLDTRSQLVLNEFLKGRSQLPPAEEFFQAGVESHLTDSLLSEGDPRKTSSQVMEAFHKAYSYLRYERFEKYGEAEQLLRKALTVEKRASYIYLTMSYLMEYQNKLDSALWYATKAQELIPTWSHATNRLGNLYEAAYQYERALKLHNSVLKSDSMYVWSYNNIGVALLSMERYHEAEKHFQKALTLKLEHDASRRLNRDWSVAYGNLGVINMERGLLYKAEAYLKKADSLDPTDTKNLRNLSNLYRKFNDGKKTEDYLRRALAVGPYEAENYYQLGEFYRYDKREMDAGKTADSLLKKAIKLNPFDHQSYSSLGYLGYDNKTDSSVTWFLKGLNASGNSPYALFDVASHYELRKKYDSAAHYMKLALKKNPYYTNASVELAKYLLALKDTLNAEKTLKDIATLQERSTLAWYNLGNFYYRIQQPNKAILQYKKALALDPMFTHATKGLIITSLETKNSSQSKKYFRQLQGSGSDEMSMEQFMTLVMETGNDMKTAERLIWLNSFIELDKTNVELNLEIAEAAYNSGKDLLTITKLLEGIEAFGDRNVYRQQKWLLLSFIELNDKKKMEFYAEKLLSGYQNIEPELQVVSYSILGYNNEAKNIKKEIGQNWKKNYKTNFIKLYSKI